MPRALTLEEYRTLVNQSPIMIWRAGLDKRCDYFNYRWLAFTGRTLEQEMGNGWAEGVHPDDLARCLGIYTGHFDQRQPFEMEYRLRRADGTYRWVLDRGVPFTTAQGAFAGYIGSCVDVTETVEARARLEQARLKEIEQLRTLLPVCAWCRKIRTDDGYWRRLEDYVHEQKMGMVTHGICEECARLHREWD